MDADLLKDVNKDDRIAIIIGLCNNSYLPLTVRNVLVGILKYTSYYINTEDDAAWNDFKIKWTGSADPYMPN